MSRFPLTRAHFLLAGGWRQNIVILGVYAALVVTLATAIYGNCKPEDQTAVSGVFLFVITLVQGLLVLLIAPGAVRKAVLRDFQSGMMESHRLTPLSGLNLVVGYLAGPTAQALLLYAAGLVMGGYLAGAYGQSVRFAAGAIGGWYFSQLCLLTLALLVIALVLLTALATKGKANLITLLVLFSVLGGWFVVPFVPGVALLMGAMSAGFLGTFLIRTGPIATTNPGVLGWAILLQVVIGVILLAAAARKVRAPDRPAFSVLLGLLLLIASGVALGAGLHFFSDYRRLFRWEQNPIWQWLGSAVAFMLVALLPLAASAEERHSADRSALLARGYRSAVWRSADFMPLLLTLMTILAMYWMQQLQPDVAFDVERRTLLVPMLVAIGLSFWTDYACIGWARGRGRSAFFGMLVAWLLLKALPLAIEGMMVFAADLARRENPTEWWFAGLSPVGTLFMATRQANPWPGIFVQGVVAAAVTVLARRPARRMPPAS